MCQQFTSTLKSLTLTPNAFQTQNILTECRISPQLTITSHTSGSKQDYKWPNHEENKTGIYFQTVVKLA